MQLAFPYYTLCSFPPLCLPTFLVLINLQWIFQSTISYWYVLKFAINNVDVIFTVLEMASNRQPPLN